MADYGEYDEGAGAGGDYEYKDADDGGGGDDGGGVGDAGAGAGGPAGGHGRWGYAGDDNPDDLDGILNGDDDGGAGEGGDEDDIKEEDVDLEHELPAFANAANRELNEVIKDTEKRLLRERSSAKENRERVAVMTEHLKNVKQELAHTQRLLEAKTKEVQTEDHLKQLAEREAGRIRQESKRLETQADLIQDQLNAVQSGIFKGSEKVEQFKVRHTVGPV